MSTANTTTTGVRSNVGVNIPGPSTLQSIAEQYGSDEDVRWERKSDIHMVDTLAG